MVSFKGVGLSLLALASAATAFTLPDITGEKAREYALAARHLVELEPRQRVPDAACTNGPNTRACWRTGYSIATDFDAKAPPSGKTVTYNLEITNTTLAPDGVSRMVMAINGQYPGPTLVADWGDTLVVNVKNSLPDNGTSIHWHGIRQMNSCQHDGVNGVTECPIAPGRTRTYTFRCTQFGTTWFHSHFSAQYVDGVVGTLVINGPATANYDEDLGVVSLTDWFYEPAFALNIRAMRSLVGPPVPVTALVNGKMKSASGGSYSKTTVTKGKRYRLRFVNIGVDNGFHVSIDNHPMQVITSDFVPIKPFVANSVFMAIGQRHDVVITANQTVGNYWIRVTPACGRNANAANIRAVLTYTGAPDADPTSTGITPAGCADAAVEPWVVNRVPEDQFANAVKSLTMDLNVAQRDGAPLIQWRINGSDILVDWSRPTLQNVQDGNFQFPSRANLYEVNGTDTTWIFWNIQTAQDDPFALPHPIHLHGHDFYVLGSGPGLWGGTANGLKFNNPPRRDTAILPAGGWLMLGFPLDNPGVWLMHCHIPWHVGQGLSVQFLERKSEIIPRIGNMNAFNEDCAAWRSYWAGPHPYGQDDSGL